MLRGENIVAGTSTTGTGTLTLAATPAAVGAVDFDVWLKATGVGFVSGNAILVSYTVIEYTDTTFVKPKVIEKGIGTLTLGASITAATLARTTPQAKSDANGAAYTVNPSAFSIGTAANVLVFIGASATDLSFCSPYFETSIGDALGVGPVGTTQGTGQTSTLTSGTEIFTPFEWRVPMLVKKATVRCNVAYTGGTPVSNADARIYAIGSNGRPGKLLLDLGLLGSAGTSLNSAPANVSSGVHSTGFYLHAGEYYFGFLAVFSGGSAGPAMLATTTATSVLSGRTGGSIMTKYVSVSATGGSIGAAPDPANTTGYAGSTSGTSAIAFLLNSS